MSKINNNFLKIVLQNNKNYEKKYFINYEKFNKS